MTLDLDTIWPAFSQRYEMRSRSLDCYRQILGRFLKWARASGYLDSSEITREVAEDYARDVFRAKATARRDINILKVEWSTLWPDAPSNPWNIGLRLVPKQLDRAMCYRRLDVAEARRFIALASRMNAESHRTGRCQDRRYAFPPELFADIADAARLAWQYGLRIGSLASLSCDDFRPDRDFFLHVPPKTAASKPYPLELPIMDDVLPVITQRYIAMDGQGPVFPALRRFYHERVCNLTMLLKRIMVAADVRDDYRGRATMHSFRASFITQMDEAGVPTGITDSITGHAAKSIHNRYCHPSIAAKRKWIEAAIPSLGPCN